MRKTAVDRRDGDVAVSSPTAPVRPQTTMGLALAQRVLTHTDPVGTVPAGDPIDLTVADPAPTPAHIGQTAKHALDQGETHYTDASGITPLRAAVAGHLAQLGFPVESESIGVTNGGTE